MKRRYRRLWRSLERSWGRYWRLIGVVFAASIVLFTAYAAYLDFQVRDKFEGKRWSIPARVYARPLELYPGLKLTIESAVEELAALNYRYSSRLDPPGSYFRSGDALLLRTRSFDFWDGTEPERRLRLTFESGYLVDIEDLERGSVALARLEPAMIGGIYPSHNEDRVLVKLEEVPPLLIDALLAVEDHRFYEHHGLVPAAVLRAALANLRAGQTVQGGSTLTQQLVKNFFLNNRRTLWRKFNEAIMALEVEWHYGKGEILEAYLNEIYLGQDGNRAIHGFGLASRFYFEKPLSDLDPAQIALLVGLVKGPSYYDPRRSPARSEARRDVVLDVMVERKLLSPDEALKARQRPLGVVPNRASGITAYPAFLDLVRRQLRRDYRDEDLTSEGLRVFTTLDPQVQAAAERALSERLEALAARTGSAAGLEGAAVVTSSESGEVLAVVGGRDPRFAGFNRALDAERQVGSLIKPAVFLAALQRPAEYTLATLLDDDPLTVESGGKPWEPRNYDRENHGPVPMFAALAKSYNVATARLGLDLGLDEVIETLQRLGVERDMAPYPSLLLGAVSLSPFEIAQMYQTFAAGGFRTPLKAIREVTNARGEPLNRYPLVVEKAFEPAQVYLVTAALQEAVRSGTGRSVYRRLPEEMGVAGKTGTTDELRDSWFAGYTGDRLAVVWVGNDQNLPTGLTGASGALPVWGDIIGRIEAQPLMPVKPSGVEHAWVDPVSGLRADEGCRERVWLPFLAGSVPPERAPCSGDRGNVMDKTFRWMRGLIDE